LAWGRRGAGRFTTTRTTPTLLGVHPADT